MHTKRSKVVGHGACGTKIDRGALSKNHHKVEEPNDVTARLMERADDLEQH